MAAAPVTEEELHAYLDGVLTPARAAAVEQYLAEHPEEATRFAAYREQAQALRRQFVAVLDEPVPQRLWPPRGWSRRYRYAAAAAAGMALLFLGGTIGWYLHSHTVERRVETPAWARRAAVAHIVYSPEVRHPVEVGADQEAHLVAWLSKRLGTPLKVPHLGGLGYSLVGGRLLPGDRGPVAQFMYQDSRGQRLTLYVRVNSDAGKETAFRFAQEGGVSVFYWLDRSLGYALSGELDKTELLRVATAVDRQFNP